jgi:hypothetical protein
VLPPALQQKLHELITKIARTAYEVGYQDGKTKAGCNPDKVRVSMASIRKIK